MGGKLVGRGNMYAAPHGSSPPSTPARIDCDEWRLLWIPDRDRELGWLAQCFIKLFLPGCCIFGLLEASLGGSGGRYGASAAPLSVDIDCHLASPFPTGLVVPQNRFSQNTSVFPPREIAQEMKLPRKTY